MVKNKKVDRVAILIEIAIILTVIPRWIPALMMSEGLTLPTSWGSWWITVSAIFNAGMAVTEAVAIAYVFSILRNRKGRDAQVLLGLAILMVVSFMVVLAPFIAASVANTTMERVITSPGSFVMALFWGGAVVLSTGFTVMAVGIAQGGGEEKISEVAYCWCGAKFENQDQLIDHSTIHYDEASNFDTAVKVQDYFKEQYSAQRDQVLPPIPNVPDIVKIKDAWDKKV